MGNECSDNSARKIGNGTLNQLTDCLRAVAEPGERGGLSIAPRAFSQAGSLVGQDTSEQGLERFEPRLSISPDVEVGYIERIMKDILDKTDSLGAVFDAVAAEKLECILERQGHPQLRWCGW